MYIGEGGGGGGGGAGVATQKNKNRKSRVGLVFFLLVFLVFCLLTIFRCSNNFKRFKKYPDTFRLLYDKGETSNQHLIITKEYNIYVRRVS